MKPNFFRTWMAAATVLVALNLCSCPSTSVGGTNADLGLRPTVDAFTELDLVPAGERISYTIDGNSSEGRQKLRKLNQREAELLAQNEAADMYRCDRLIDPRFIVRWKGKRIEAITVSGRPGVYRIKGNQSVTAEQPLQETAAQGRMIYHEVREGETLKQVAKAYNVSISNIVKWNSLSSSTLTPGMKLKIHFK